MFSRTEKNTSEIIQGMGQPAQFHYVSSEVLFSVTPTEILIRGSSRLQKWISKD